MSRLAVIFDMDGVLINSHPHNAQALDLVLSEYGLNFSTIVLDYGEKWKSASFKDLLQWLSDHHGVTIDIVGFSKKVDESSFEIMGSRGDLIDMLLPVLLTELKKNDVKLGVASSSQRGRIHKTLELIGIDHYFDVVIGAEDVTRHKPSPDVYIKVAQLLSVSPSECLVFEDSIAGVASAKTAGTKVVAYTKFHESTQHIDEADLHIDNFGKINYTLIEKIVHNKRTPV
ncbi:MAG: HAD family phosphatase [Bacteroidota bacterium]|nr:HAD family phosphatase [Bacteroidota bacterium]